MKCKSGGCEDLALYSLDVCWEHLSDRDAYKKKLIDLLNNGSDLTGCNLKKVDLKNAHLEKARLPKSNLSQANLSGAHLFDAKLVNADLVGADLSRCELAHCDLRDADLTKSNLQNSRLWNARLEGANLNEADLTGSDLWNTCLFNVKLWHTLFADARSLSMRNFYKTSGLLRDPKINETGAVSAEESYRDLKRYFISNGMYNDAGWASFREKVMERLIMKKNRDLRYLPSLLMNFLCGYGERPSRIVLSSLLTILLFAFFYLSFNTIESSSGQNVAMNLSDYLYYSTITFTTVGYGDFIPKPHTFPRLLAAAEAFMGVFLTGLFIFTLARKYSAR
ncbi:MAG: hypothetical protein A2987_04730 [Omnitrophica bacterium RIFCSPLOWO2_01_FULL_45_10]|nr:MAG: hypothetical protein A2987_04730 [Omnitrophica bacterium RIFCSPLOWO2_01_FULL_45_10]